MAVQWELFDANTRKPIGSVYAADEAELRRIVESRYGNRDVRAKQVTSARGQFALGLTADTGRALGGLADLSLQMPTTGVGLAALPLRAAGVPIPSVAAFGERAGTALASAAGVNPVEPQTKGQGYARAAGRATGQLPLVAATGGMSTVPAAAANVAGAFGGELAAEGAKNLGGGPLIQGGAGILGDLAATALTRRVGNRLAGVPRAAAVAKPSRMQRRVFESIAPLDIADAKSRELLSEIQKRYTVLTDVENTAWQAVPQRGVGQVDGRPLVEAARKIIADEVGDSADLVRAKPPEIVEAIAARLGDDGAPKPFTFENLRKTQRTITSLIRDAGAEGATDVQRQQAAMARKLQDSVDQALDELARTGGDAAAVDALRKAKDASKAVAINFDRGDAIFKKLIDPNTLVSDPHRAIEAVIRSPRSIEMAQTLADIAGQTEGGRRALRGAFVDVSAGQSAQSFSAKSTLKFVEEHAAEGRAMMGKDAFGHYQGVLREIIAAGEKHGRKTFAHRLSLYAGYGAAAAVANKFGIGAGAVSGATAGSVLETIGQYVTTDSMTRVARTALVDRDLYQLLRAPPTAANLARADLYVNALLIRAGMRSQNDARRPAF